MSDLTRRSFIHVGLGAGIALARPARTLLAWSPNDTINVGFIGCGGRAGSLMKSFAGISGVNIAGLCDPDRSRLESARKKHPQAKAWTDLRNLLDDQEIDAVVIATSNQWHCLAAVWAMEAGKDVYVEKPLSHSQWEGRQVIAAARKYGRVCQVGTQQRSDPMQEEIKSFLHEERVLGRIRAARVNRFGIRESIGKRSKPLPIPDHVDYNLWLGPAQDEPIYRDRLQYDWHWDWNTGSGEMGNWGVHVLDDLRNNVFRDEVSLPKRILGGGGRVSWMDAGETPNVHFVYFDTGTIPVVIAISNLAAQPGSSEPPAHPGPGSGYIAYCEGGRLEGQRRKAAAFDSGGKKIREFSGNSGNGIHQQNFIEAVRRRDPSILNSDVQVGHDSTGWCNLANIAFLVGSPSLGAKTFPIRSGADLWEELLEEMHQLLTAHQVDLKDAAIRMSPILEVDPRSERFVGEHAKVGNRYLKREYRDPFVLGKVSS